MEKQKNLLETQLKTCLLAPYPIINSELYFCICIITYLPGTAYQKEQISCSSEEMELVGQNFAFNGDHKTSEVLN